MWQKLWLLFIDHQPKQLLRTKFGIQIYRKIRSKLGNIPEEDQLLKYKITFGVSLPRLALVSISLALYDPYSDRPRIPLKLATLFSSGVLFGSSRAQITAKFEQLASFYPRHPSIYSFLGNKFKLIPLCSTGEILLQILLKFLP